MHKQQSIESGFRPDIEGLRAVAVTAVVLFHAQIPGIGGGYVGVDVFFVISGFLITRILWREVHASGRVRLANFYGARARRLLPASAFVGIVTMVLAALLLPPLHARTVLTDGIYSALYVSNYRFAFQDVDYLASNAPPSPFQHYWSLGVEEQFYLIWPALILGTAWSIRTIRRSNKTAATASKRPYLSVLLALAVTSFALSIAATHWAPPVAFFSLPTRAWQLAVGGLVALTAAHWQRLSTAVLSVAGWSGLGMIVLACVSLGPTTHYPGTAALLPTLGAALVIGAGCGLPNRGCGSVLGLAPMRAIGRISYSLYLWHWPVLLMALWAIAPVTGHTLLLALAGIALSVGLAVLTTRIIENPLRFAAPIRNSAGRSLALGGAATALAVAVGLVLHVPDPVGRGTPGQPLAVVTEPVPAGSPIEAYDRAVRQAFAQVEAAVAASVDLQAVPSNLAPPLANLTSDNPRALDGCIRTFFEVAQPECATGDAASGSTVALVGDSNAAMWDSAFQDLAGRRKWRLETMTKVSCPMLDLPTLNPVLGRDYTECGQWRDGVIARLQAERPTLIVLSVMRRYGVRYGWGVGYTSYESAWVDSVARLVRQLRDTGAQVLVLGPIPDPQSAVPDCLTLHLDDATSCSPPISKAVNREGIAAEAAATAASDGQYADLTDLFCTKQRCPVIVGNTLVYLDQSHLTYQYSRILAPVIGALADRALAQR
ncbi:acyltransferase family protein [Mycobacterium sp. M26]|uniref:acyltransferase family protein n=1 Tax=Mycobacterium sp. M26 TaxID=1762962 RepID=UPI00073E12EB|nr:acyltransferase family protein [Mycobacterium sp. M26]